MHSFARAAVTKYHELSGLNSKNVLSHISRGFKSKIKESARLVPLSSGGRWWSLAIRACRSTTPATAFLFTWCSVHTSAVQISLSEGPQSHWVRILIFSFLPLQRPRLQIRLHSEVRAVRNSSYEFQRNTILTHNKQQQYATQCLC